MLDVKGHQSEMKFSNIRDPRQKHTFDKNLKETRFSFSIFRLRSSIFQFYRAIGSAERKKRKRERIKRRNLQTQQSRRM